MSSARHCSFSILPNESNWASCAVIALAVLFVGLWACRDVNSTYGAKVPKKHSAAIVDEPAVPLPCNEPKVASAFIGDTIGCQIDDMTYSPSSDTAQYYTEFHPNSLENTMPAGWRSNAKNIDDGVYKEFNRYVVSPSHMKKAEAIRSSLRLGQLSRDGLSRSLGQRSLLRDYVTPMGPNPLNNTAMLFNDSSVRQNQIASATGQYPDLSQRC